MAERPQDHPQEHTIGAKVGRVMGEDAQGRGAVSVFFSELGRKLTFGHSPGDTTFAAGAAAVVLIPVALIGGGIMDQDIAQQPELAGKFNLINGYAIAKVEDQFFMLVHGQDGRFEVYNAASSNADFRLIGDAAKAREYAALVTAAYNTSLAQEELPTSSGNPLPGTYYVSSLSLPYEVDGQVRRETGVLNNNKFENIDSKTYFQQSRDFWNAAATGITGENYGVPADKRVQYTDEYRYWNHAIDTYVTGAQYAGIGYLAIAGALAVFGTARQVRRRRPERRM